MKHVVTITPQMFKEADYMTCCALTKALELMFPQAESILVGTYDFKILFTDPKFNICRDLISCQLESHCKLDHPLEDLLLEMHEQPHPDTVIFNFITVHVYN